MTFKKYISIPVTILTLIIPSIAMSQVCSQNVTKTTPSHHFKVHGNGTVTDKATNLMWKVCSEGQTWSSTECTGTATNHNWKQALQIPAILNVSGGYAGYTDWRLPNINELQSIAELSCHDPAINKAVFFNTPYDIGYLSSSPSSVRILDFRNGNITIINGRKVRLVRNPQD